jgi:hypothetical protein
LDSLDELLRLFHDLPRHSTDFAKYCERAARKKERVRNTDLSLSSAATLMPKIIDEQYQPVKEKALEALLVFFDRAPGPLVGQMVPELTRVLLQRFAGGRDSCRTRAMEVL